MYHHKALLFVFYVAFSSLSLANDLGEDYGLTLLLGQNKIKPLNTGFAPGIELYSYYDSDKKTPQRLIAGYTQLSSNDGRKRGDVSVFYVGFDIATKFRLHRHFIPYLSVALKYGYINENGIFETDNDGFAITGKTDKSTNDFFGYIMARDVFKISREPYEFSLRFNLGTINGLTLGIGRQF